VISTEAYRKVFYPKELPEIVRVMFLYRYVSLTITSLFYLLANINHSVERKAFIIICIALSSLLLNYLYMKNRNSTAKVKLLVLIETLGNTFILIPSGGLNSPYVWYSLNTILIASIELKRKYAWINLFIYLFGSTWLSYLLFNLDEVSFLSLIKEKSNLILSFTLITLAMQLLAKYLRAIQEEGIKLSQTNYKLTEANHKIKDSLNYIMELYDAVQLFTTLKNKKDLIQLIKEYTRKITKSEMVIFYELTDYKNKIIVKTGQANLCLEERLKLEISEKWSEIINSKTPLQLIIDKRKFIFVPVKSDYMVFGILGIEIISNEESMYQDNIDQLQFLAHLSSIVLERFRLEQVNERLLVSEEQNRIANELHDSALQRLFGISCGMYSLIKNLQETTVTEIEKELNTMQSALDNTMKELRLVIYGLSWKKDGVNNFIADTQKYIEEIKLLNNIEINLNITGTDEILSYPQKKAIYRIICEGISNALHHGRASEIEVILRIETSVTLLQVIDNGIGFNINHLKNNEEQGLGLRNIRYLVNSLNGTIDLQSKPVKGTRLQITLPNNPNFTKGEVV